jgi:hypothetical protein
MHMIIEVVKAIELQHKHKLSSKRNHNIFNLKNFYKYGMQTTATLTSLVIGLHV